ncbi:MAG: outer membrane lipoprotein-sorting protein [Kiritimatiellae bacterium]|nr:outer membrane lipoprotein-sorting protein [Kiritimatiellia bacterium]
MKMRIFSLATLGLGIFLAAAEGFCAEDKEPTPLTLVEQCRAMVPQNVSISGRIVLRNRRGIVQAEYSYALERKEGETTLVVKDPGGNEVPFKKEGRLLGTDVTWSDLTLDYLWWDDFGYDAERESETVHGQVCSVVLMRKAERSVRVWVDRKTGAMMQAEELASGKPVRRLWGTRIKKFGERWAPNVLEVETTGSGHRTKIIVEELK